jgi:voltage-dependent potassium channel beta subunit
MKGSMKYRMLGRSGLEVSAISLGSWATIGDGLDIRQTCELLSVAYDAGVNLFDTSETYADGAAEEMLGRSIRQLGWPRETFIICSKVFYGTHSGRPNTWGLSRKHIREGCDASLRRLGVGYLDLFLCHRHDDRIPLDEIVAAMGHLIAQGKVLYWGTSEWPSALVRQAQAIAAESGLQAPVTEQLQYSILTRANVERSFSSLITETGIGLMTWSPLEYGLLAGRYDTGLPASARLTRPDLRWLRQTALGDDEQATLDRARRVNALARSLGMAPAQMALAWVLRNPHVSTAICGASSTEQLGESLDDSLHDRLDDEATGELEKLLSEKNGYRSQP